MQTSNTGDNRLGIFYTKNKIIVSALLKWIFKFKSISITQLCSVVDPKLFIPDPDPALNFPSSGSRSRQKFRIHADNFPSNKWWWPSCGRCAAGQQEIPEDQSSKDLLKVEVAGIKQELTIRGKAFQILYLPQSTISDAEPETAPA